MLSLKQISSVPVSVTATALVALLALPTSQLGNCKVGLKFYQEMRVGLPELQALHIAAQELELSTQHEIMKDEKLGPLSPRGS